MHYTCVIIPDAMVSKSVLITGGNGFIGANLIRHLIKNGYTVHVLLRKTSDAWRLEGLFSLVSIHIVDLFKLADVRKTFKSIHPLYILHLMSYGNYPEQTNFINIIQSNILSVTHLLEASRDIAYTSFVIAGSSSEYGFKKKPMKETDILEPESYYASAKGSVTLIAQAFAKLHKKPITILRLFSVYGPYEKPSRFIPAAITAALRDRVFPLAPHTARRDFIYIADVISAIIKTMTTVDTYGEVFNIGTGKQYSNEDVITYIEVLLHKKIQINKGAFTNRSWDTPHWVANIQKSKNILQWEPEYTLEKGLEASIVWFRKNIQYYQ